MIVTDERVAPFVGNRVNSIIYPPFTVMGIERDGEIIAGAVFNCYTGHAVDVTIAGHGWTRGFCRAVGDYVFRQLGCDRMQAVTAQEDVARFAERLGGVREGTLRDRFGPGKNGILIGILKQEYMLW